MKIVIHGRAGEGKTTMAILLQDLLRAVGFDVANNDIDVINNDDAVDEAQPRRIRELTNPLSSKQIVIETEQTR